MEPIWAAIVLSFNCSHHYLLSRWEFRQEIMKSRAPVDIFNDELLGEKNMILYLYRLCLFASYTYNFVKNCSLLLLPH